MIPDCNSKNCRNGHGIMYEVMPEEKDKVLWRVKGWYSSELYISNCGMYLVRVGHIPESKVILYEDVGVAFYKEGNLLKCYTIHDLIHEESTFFTKHMNWFDYKKPKLVFHFFFVLTTVDGIEYVFDIRTSEIVPEIDQGLTHLAK